MTPQETAANFMAAAAHLLVGAADRNEELNEKVAIMFGGETINHPTLMHWGDWVRSGGRPIIHFSFSGESGLPTIVLVCAIDGEPRMFENCLLWQRRDGEGAVLVPDDFRWGAYSIDEELNLVHHDRPPVLCLRAARDGITRAWRRLSRIQDEQLASGRTFMLPKLLERRAA